MIQLSERMLLIVLLFTVTNVNAETKDVLACTEEGLSLQCPDSEVIHITNVTYGRLNVTICVGGNYTTSNCASQTAFSTLSALCNGKYDCRIVPSTSLFGDPCPAVTKYLQVKYECGACVNTHESDLDCDQWALAGECTNNYAWMSVNCRQSCWQCQDAELCSNIHDTSDCRYWASTGECTRNSQWMTINCQKSCNLCDHVETGIPSGAYQIPYSGFQCDGHVLNMHCPLDYTINMTSAFYGRQDNASCPVNELNNNVYCSVDGALMAVSSLCNNQQACNITVSPAVIGQDNCPSVSKYFSTQYSCTQATFTAHGCDGNTTWLECPGSAVIRVMSVMYGRNNNSACSANITDSTVPCQSNTALTVLSQLCNGQSSCALIPSTSLFDDPCPGISKYADIVYTCTACINEYGSDAQCNAWKESQQCDVNPGWMIANCRKSCWKCQSAELCNDVYDSSYCRFWAAIGQCADNPSWMNVNCRRSCNKCLPSDATISGTTRTTTPATTTTSFTTNQNLSPTTATMVLPESDFEMKYSALACENDVLHVLCPTGYVIEVKDAFYGRNNNMTCSSSQANYTVNCSVDSAFAAVSNLCNGRQGCDILSAVETFTNDTNPCPETSKFFTMNFVCKQATVAVHGCNSDITWLSCNGSNVVRVQNVMYGRDNGSICTNDTVALSTQCQSSTATATVSQLCNGQPNCALLVSTALFGDPCPGISKYADIYYTCTACTNDFGNDTACDGWAQSGQCQANPGWMIAYCRKSCWNCQYADSCTDMHEEDVCRYWAANGECANNPAWMNVNCQQSCNKCTAPLTTPPMPTTSLLSTQGDTTLLPSSAQPQSTSMPPTASQQSSSATVSANSLPPTTVLPPSVQPSTTVPLPSAVPSTAASPPSTEPPTTAAPPPSVQPPSTATQPPSAQPPTTAALPPSAEPPTAAPPPSVQPPTAAPPSAEPPTAAPPPSVQPPTAAPPPSVQPPTAAPPSAEPPTAAPPSAEPPTAAPPPSVHPPTAEPPTVQPPQPPTALSSTIEQSTTTTVVPPTGPVNTVPTPATSSPSAPTSTPSAWIQISLQVKISDNWQDIYSDMTNPSTRGYANNLQQTLTNVYKGYYSSVAVSVLKLSQGSVIVDLLLAFPASENNVTVVNFQCKTRNYLPSNMAYTTSDLETLCLEYFCGSNVTQDICSCASAAEFEPQCTTVGPVSPSGLSTTNLIIIVVCTVGGAIVIAIIVIVAVCCYRRYHAKKSFFNVAQPHEVNGLDNAAAEEHEHKENRKYEFSMAEKTPSSQSKFARS